MKQFRFLEDIKWKYFVTEEDLHTTFSKHNSNNYRLIFPKKEKTVSEANFSLHHFTKIRLETSKC